MNPLRIFVNWLPRLISKVLISGLLICAGLNMTFAGSFRAEALSTRYIEVTRDLKIAEDAPGYDASGNSPSISFKVYRSQSAQTVLQADYSQQAISTAPFGGRPVVRQRWILELVQALEMGDDVEILIHTDTDSDILSVQFDDSKITGSISVNQVGYLPHANKTGWVGNWTGMRGLSINTAHFELRNTLTDQVVFAGELSGPIQDDIWSGNLLYRAEFSSFTETGSYQLYVPGVGRSYPFVISDALYHPIVEKTFKSFYHHRNSNAVVEPFAQAGYGREGGSIPQKYNAVFHSAVSSGQLANGEQAGEFREIKDGWFDAGDFGQYIVNAAPVWHYFSTALDLAPSLGTVDNLGIPESGNAQADILDELEWGYDWARSMQADDGGVYSRVVSECWDQSLPKYIDKPRFIYEKTTHATASFAALSAIHSRLMGSGESPKAKLALEAAKAAWNYLEVHPRWPAEGEVYRNPPGTCAGEYQDSSSLDNHLWAAAELYRTTGEPRFREFYETHQPHIHHDVQAMPTFGRSEMSAAWAYLMTDDAKKSPKVVSDLRLKFDIGARDRAKYSRLNPVGAIINPTPMWVGWGTLAQSTRHTFPLLQAYVLSGVPSYFELALETPNFQLGLNPLNLSFITGVGSQYPKNPLSKLQEFLGNDEPIHGLPINGPVAELRNTLQAYQQINRQYVPPDRFNGSTYGRDYLYPVMRRYVDSQYLPIMQEPTLTEYAYTFTAYAVLNELAQKHSALDGLSSKFKQR